MEVNEAELPWEQLGFFVFSLVFLFGGHTVFASIPYLYSILCYDWIERRLVFVSRAVRWHGHIPMDL